MPNLPQSPQDMAAAEAEEQKKLEEEAKKQEEENRETYRQYRLSGNVVIRQRDEAIKDLMDAGFTEEKANEEFEKWMANFLGSKIDIDFVKNTDNIMGVLREMKDVVEKRILEEGYMADDVFFELRTLIGKIYKD